MKPTVEEVRAEYMRLKGSSNRKSQITLIELAKEKGYNPEEFKLLLVKEEQGSTHVSKSPRRNRRREKRQALMRERYNL